MRLAQPHNAQGELPDRDAEQGDTEALSAFALPRERARQRNDVGDDEPAVPHQEPRVERALLRAQSHVQRKGAVLSTGTYVL